MLPSIVEIYDIDGVLLSSLHRYSSTNGRIDLQHWRANSTPDKIAKDSLLPTSAQYKASLKNPNIFVIVATSRVTSEADYQVIRQRLGFPHLLIHRVAEWDQRKGETLKLQGILPIIEYLNPKTIRVYEDNAKYLSGILDGLKSAGFLAEGFLIHSAQNH